MKFVPWSWCFQSRGLNGAAWSGSVKLVSMKVPRRESENRYLRAYGDLVRVGFILPVNESSDVPTVRGVPSSPWDQEACWVQK